MSRRHRQSSAGRGTIGKGAAAVAPDLVSILPTTGANAGGTTIAGTGTDFTAGLVVEFGSDVLTWEAATGFVFNSATDIDFDAPVATAIDAGLSAGGVVSIRVTNGNGTDTLADCYTYDAAPAPNLVSIDPISGPYEGGTTITLTGTDFTADMEVKVGLDNAGFTADDISGLTFVNSTTFTFSIMAASSVDPSAFLPGGVAADIKVINGLGEDTLLNCYTYDAAI